MQPPALIWKVWWGWLPLRLLAARLGLGFTGLGTVTLYLERTLCSLPGLDGARRSCLISPDLTELGDWSQLHLYLNLSNASFRPSGPEQVTEPPRVSFMGTLMPLSPAMKRLSLGPPSTLLPCFSQRCLGPEERWHAATGDVVPPAGQGSLIVKFRRTCGGDLVPYHFTDGNPEGQRHVGSGYGCKPVSGNTDLGIT